MTNIVVRRPFKILSPGQGQCAIIVTGGTDIGLVSQVLNPLVIGAENPAYFGGPVGGRVIADYQFEDGKSLAQQTVQRSSEVVFPVKYRQADTKSRYLFHPGYGRKASS